IQTHFGGVVLVAIDAPLVVQFDFFVLEQLDPAFLLLDVSGSDCAGTHQGFGNISHSDRATLTDWHMSACFFHHYSRWSSNRFILLPGKLFHAYRLLGSTLGKRHIKKQQSDHYHSEHGKRIDRR